MIPNNIDTMNEILQLLKEIKRTQGLQKDVFNMDDFCCYTGMSKDHAYHLTSSGKIKFYRPCGKLIFFEAEDVKNFLKQNPVDAQVAIDATSNRFLQGIRI